MKADIIKFESKDSTSSGGARVGRGVTSIVVVDSTPSEIEDFVFNTKGGDDDDNLSKSRLLEEEVENDIANL